MDVLMPSSCCKSFKCGYLIFIFLFLGILLLSHVSSHSKVGWVPEYIILAPGLYFDVQFLRKKDGQDSSSKHENFFFPDAKDIAQVSRHEIVVKLPLPDIAGPAILVSPTKPDEKGCGDISTDECLKKLQTFLRLRTLPFPKEEKQLNKLCSDTVEGYNCSSRKVTVPNCASSKDKDLIPVFIEMAQYTMLMFCSSNDGALGYLREDLLKYSDCVQKQKDAIDCCVEGSKLADLPIMHFLDQSSRSLNERQIAACCPTSHYIKCVQTVVLKNCGEIAANMTTEYIRRSSGAQMDSVCQKLPGYPEPSDDVCKTPAPVCSGTRIGIFAQITVLICLMFLMCIYCI